MKRALAMVLVLVMMMMCCIPVAALAKAKQMEDGVPVWTEETVRQYALDYISGKHMSRLYGYYDLQIRRYMPLSAYESFLTTLEWMTGDFLELGSSYSCTVDAEQQLKTHVIHLCMEKQDLDLYFTHKDKEDDWEVMALQFVPADKQDRPSGLDLLVDEGDSTPQTKTVTYTETEIAVGDAEAPLKGILTMPEEAQNAQVPGCVLVHDVGALDMDCTMGNTAFFKDLAHTLAEMGIASIRYDKRAYTYPEQEFDTVWDEVVADAISAGQLLKDNAAIDPARIVVIGHGFGANQAPRIVSQSDGIFTAMIMIGGSPISYATQLLNASDQSVYTKDELKELKYNINSLSTMSEAKARELTLFGRNGYFFWEMEQYNPVKLIKKLKLQTYIIQGRGDPVVSEEDGWRAYSEEIGDGITYVGFKSYRGLNHILMNDLSTDANGQPQYPAEVTLDKAAGREISQWILSLYKIEVEE